MVGREMADFFVRTDTSRGELVLRVDRDSGATGVFEDVSFEVHAGEVVGFAGLVGAGRTDVALALFGIAPAEGGTIELDGRPVVIRTPRDAMRLGIAYLSEDRRRLGLSMPQSVPSNITLRELRPLRDAARPASTARAEHAVAERFREPAAASARRRCDTPVGNLSGGNQQKTMLAKWLNAEPTRAHPRRADPRHRRRRQGRRPPDHRRPGPLAAWPSSSSRPTCPRCWR